MAASRGSRGPRDLPPHLRFGALPLLPGRLSARGVASFLGARLAPPGSVEGRGEEREQLG